MLLLLLLLLLLLHRHVHVWFVCNWDWCLRLWRAGSEEVANYFYPRPHSSRAIEIVVMSDQREK